MANCVTCKARCENAGQHRVKTDCISYIPKDYPKPQTNADRIRAMSDEELAKWLNHMQADAYDRGLLEERIVGYPNNYSTWLDWLRQEAQT